MGGPGSGRRKGGGKRSIIKNKTKPENTGRWTRGVAKIGRKETVSPTVKKVNRIKSKQ